MGRDESSSAFGELGRRAQIARMRRSAALALHKFGIEPTELRLLNHDFNTTFRVDTTSGPLALRLNLNSARTISEVRAEVEWTRCLAGEEGRTVASPVATPEGEWAVAVPVHGIPNPVPAVLYNWLDGPNLGRRVSRPSAQALGCATARLHHHSAGWTAPARADYPALNAVLMNSPDYLTGRVHWWLDNEARQILERVNDQVGTILAPVFAGPTQVIHADLHPWNVKWHRHTLAIFDFDDCGRGVPLQDLAISAYYLRRSPVLEEAVMEGYVDVRPMPEHTAEQFEALVASRNLLLVNDLAASVIPYEEDFMAKFGARSVKRLGRYLDTGRYAVLPDD